MGSGQEPRVATPPVLGWLQPPMHHSLAEFLVTQAAVVLFIAALVAVAARKLKLPYTVLLVVAGLALGQVGQRLEAFEFLHGIELSPDVILFVFLPILVFESAFNLDVRLLFKNLTPVLFLAVPGLLLSTALTGAIMHGAAGFSLGVALLFGALISATDPVAVVALFKELGAPKRLTILVEGESLINDGTALVVFLLILDIIQTGGSLTAATLFGGVVEFFRVALGGIVAGALLGYLTARLIAAQEEAPLIEIALTLVLAPASFVAAERFHVSGVISTVTAGLLMGSYGRTKISPTSFDAVEKLWEFLAFLANSFIFLLVGLSVPLTYLFLQWDAVTWALVATLAARACSVFGLMYLAHRLFSLERVSLGLQTVIWWGGLRGALALGIALSLPAEFASKEEILGLSVGVVLFTVFVNALTIRPLMSWLGVDRLSPSDRLELTEGALMAKERVLRQLPDLAEEAGLLKAVVQPLESATRLRKDELREELELVRTGRDPEASGRPNGEVVALRASLRVQKARGMKLFEEGLLSEESLRRLVHEVDHQIDRTSLGLGPDMEHSPHPPLVRLIEWCVDRLHDIPALAWTVRQYRLDRTAREYELARGRLLTTQAALDALDEMEKEKVLAPEALKIARTFFEAWNQSARVRTESLEEHFPGYARHLQSSMAERYLLKLERSELSHLLHRGLISDRAGNQGLQRVERELEEVRRRPHARLSVKPVELLAQLPYFAGLPRSELGKIARALEPGTFLDGDVIVERGKPGDSLFLIGSGSVSVEEGDGYSMAILGQGEFFGEGSFLSGKPRSNTVRARAPVVVLELSRRRVGGIQEDHPEIAGALRLAYRDRLLPQFLMKARGFRLLDADQFKELCSLLEPVRFEEGDVLIEAGKTPEWMLVIEQGLVRGTAGEASEDLGPDALVGAREFFEGKMAPMTMKAVETTEAFALTREVLDGFLARSKNAARRLAGEAWGND